MSGIGGIEFNDRTQAVWFVELPRGDWLAGLEALDGGRIRLTYRFRWYKDRKAWDSKDVRNWMRAEASSDVAKGMEIARVMVRKMQEIGAGQVTELLRGNLSTRDFFDLYRHQTFVHSKTMTKEEYEAERGPIPPDVLARAIRRSDP